MSRRRWIVLIVSIWVGWCLTLWSLEMASLGLPPFLINVSDSSPRGIYLAMPPWGLRVGTLVVVKAPAWVSQRYLGGMKWILKPIGGMGSDDVCVVDGHLTVKGEDYGPVAPAINPPPQELSGCYTLRDDEVFLSSTVEKSLDSRYLGSFLRSEIMARAIPLWTWR
jgi:type IV secretory pathway protease TraF